MNTRWITRLCLTISHMTRVVRVTKEHILYILKQSSGRHIESMMMLNSPNHSDEMTFTDTHIFLNELFLFLYVCNRPLNLLLFVSARFSNTAEALITASYIYITCYLSV